MAWTAAEIEEIAARRPRLGVALWQVLAQRTVDCGQRIEIFSVDDVARRLARSLIRFSDRLGTPRDDGSIRIPALTHSFLSQYVGTSREVVTAYMIHFRRQGYIRYSRTEMTVVPEAFKDWLRKGCRRHPKDDAATQHLPHGRIDRDHFICPLCGYAAHADINAARNILALGRQQWAATFSTPTDRRGQPAEASVMNKPETGKTTENAGRLPKAA